MTIRLTRQIKDNILDAFTRLPSNDVLVRNAMLKDPKYYPTF